MPSSLPQLKRTLLLPLDKGDSPSYNGAMNEQVAKLIAETDFNKFEQEAKAAIDLVYEQLKVPELKDITEIIWNGKMSRTAGTALYTNRWLFDSTGYNKRLVKKAEIKLSTKIFSIFSEDERISTAVHEAVHIVDRYKGNPRDKKTEGHGPTWQALMRQAGFEPDRYHCANTTLFRKRYEAFCQFCKKRWEISANMRTRLLNGYRGAVCTCHGKPRIFDSQWKLMKQEII